MMDKACDQSAKNWRRTETKIFCKNLVVCVEGALRKKTVPEAASIPGSQSKIAIYIICSTKQLLLSSSVY